MIFLHNLRFFNKNGDSLSQSKTLNINVEITDEFGEEASLIPVTSEEGQLIGCFIENGGHDFIDPTIVFTDKITAETYKIPKRAITITNGVLTEIKTIDEPFGFSFPYMTMSSTLHFDEVPEDLIETEHIFILEQCVNVHGDAIYSRPIHDVTKYIESSKILNSDDKITQFTVDFDNEYPDIVKDKSNLEKFAGNETYNTNMVHVTSQVFEIDSMQFNYMITGFLDHIFEAAFDLKVNDHSIFTLNLRGESIMEDERFALMLANFGISISKEDELIFRDSDISEHLPNYAMLNMKRKEMLLEFSNIFPHIGSYKAIENILKFFDYGDLRLKEYWINTKILHDEQKDKQIEVPGIGNDKIASRNPIDKLTSQGYRKTRHFSIFYDINKLTGTTDSFGIPNTTDAFNFTIEEVLIKLMSLKKYLEKKFLPLNAHIIDVVGEGIYFERFTLSTWNDFVRRFDISLDGEPDFAFKNTEHYIVNTTDFKNTIEALPTNNDDKISDIADTFIGNYQDSDKYDDNESQSVGCILDLALIPIGLTWEEMNMSWEDLETNQITAYSNTWDSINNGDFYEMTWEFIYEDPNKFHRKFRGTIKEMTNFSTILPYTGKYSVKMILHDLRNLNIARLQEIEVKQFNPDIIGFTNFSDAFQTWDEVKNKTWNDLSGTFAAPLIKHDVKFDDINISWDSLSLQKFISSEPTIDLQNKEMITYVMDHDVIEGYIQNVNSYDELTYTPVNSNIVQTGSSVFFKSGHNIIKRNVISATLVSGIVTLVMAPSNSKVQLSGNWEMLREIKGALYVDKDAESDKIVPGTYIYNAAIDNAKEKWDIVASLTNRETEISLTSPINTKLGERFNIFNEHSAVVNAITNGIIEIKTVLSDYNLGEQEGEITDANGKVHRVVITSVDDVEVSAGVFHSFLTCEWVNSHYSSVVLAGKINLLWRSNDFSAKQIKGETTTGTTLLCDFVVDDYDNLWLEKTTGWKIERSFNYNVLNVKVIGKIDNDSEYILVLDDVDNVSLLLDSNFRSSWTDFDLFNALVHSNTAKRSWEDLSELTWEDLAKHTWADLFIVPGIKPSFSILDVHESGTIKFNEYEQFQFTTLHNAVTKAEKIAQFDDAILELNNSSNEGISKFEYAVVIVDSVTPDPEDTTLRIEAVSKTFSQESLGYILFGNGVSGVYTNPAVSHSYPIGPKIDWMSPEIFGEGNSQDRQNAVSSTYYSRGIDTLGNKGWYPQYHGMPNKFTQIKNESLWKIYPMNYMNAIMPNVTWDNIVVSNDFIDAPNASTIYFTDDNSGIAGKVKRKWGIHKDGNVLIETDRDFISWFFTEKGKYDIHYSISDINGNMQETIKKGFVTIK